MITRKQFLRRAIDIATGVVADAVEKRLPSEAIRTGLFPPGAVSGFSERCTSCGDCVDACPEAAIELTLDGPTGQLLPTITPSRRPCAMCNDFPCIDSCGDGALAPPLANQTLAIGVAHVQEASCLAFNGSACMICYDACPRKRTALILERNKPVVDASVCSGCGMCEFACPIEKTGIVVGRI
ncbi:MAG: 4Fe-4S binding protein [Candidatus Latescibacterota bacterium]|nr:MAG: 4Fe-4S binding protein [Candidatus Latescibacterota bacterium]